MRVNLCRSLRAASVMTSKIAEGYQQNSKWQRNGGKRFVETWMDMDSGLKKLGQLFQVLMLCLKKKSSKNKCGC